MLCPCCGGGVLRSATECGCGARFVGEPLDDPPIKVQRLGPAMTSVALLALVVAAALVATKWLAFAGVLALWSAWRAMRLARRDAEWYGGYKTAAATFAVTILSGAGLAAYGIAHIPQALDNYKTRHIAATQAAMYHAANALEEYKRTIGIGSSYPKDAQEFKKATGESLPADYWDQTLKYESRIAPIAERSEPSQVSNTNFELRSAGPDGIVGTGDDIVMRDGVILPNPDPRDQKFAQQSR